MHRAEVCRRFPPKSWANGNPKQKPQSFWWTHHRIRVKQASWISTVKIFSPELRIQLLRWKSHQTRLNVRRRRSSAILCPPICRRGKSNFRKSKLSLSISIFMTVNFWFLIFIKMRLFKSEINFWIFFLGAVTGLQQIFLILWTARCGCFVCVKGQLRFRMYQLRWKSWPKGNGKWLKHAYLHFQFEGLGIFFVCLFCMYSCNLYPNRRFPTELEWIKWFWFSNIKD